MQAIKGKTSNQLMRDFRALSKELWGRHPLGTGLFRGVERQRPPTRSSRSLELQGEAPEDDDKFRISG